MSTASFPTPERAALDTSIHVLIAELEKGSLPFAGVIGRSELLSLGRLG